MLLFVFDPPMDLSSLFSAHLSLPLFSTHAQHPPFQLSLTFSLFPSSFPPPRLNTSSVLAFLTICITYFLSLGLISWQKSYEYLKNRVLSTAKKNRVRSNSCRICSSFRKVSLHMRNDKAQGSNLTAQHQSTACLLSRLGSTRSPAEQRGGRPEHLTSPWTNKAPHLFQVNEGKRKQMKKQKRGVAAK